MGVVAAARHHTVRICSVTPSLSVQREASHVSHSRVRDSHDPTAVARSATLSDSTVSVISMLTVEFESQWSPGAEEIRSWKQNILRAVAGVWRNNWPAKRSEFALVARDRTLVARGLVGSYRYRSYHAWNKGDRQCPFTMGTHPVMKSNCISNTTPTQFSKLIVLVVALRL